MSRRYTNLLPGVRSNRRNKNDVKPKPCLIRRNGSILTESDGGYRKFESKREAWAFIDNLIVNDLSKGITDSSYEVVG